MCMLSNDIYDYTIVSQGKTTIPNLDDGEECEATDVSLRCHKPFITFEGLLVWFSVFATSRRIVLLLHKVSPLNFALNHSMTGQLDTNGSHSMDPLQRIT